jgi:hypothetical protein
MTYLNALYAGLNQHTYEHGVNIKKYTNANANDTPPLVDPAIQTTIAPIKLKNSVHPWT